MTTQEQDADFVDFVHASWHRLYRTAYLLLGDHGLAEDLTQTALAKTYVAWSRVRDREATLTYARTTLVNTSTSWFRRRSWRNELPREHVADDLLAHTPDPSDRPALMDALAALPPRQRAVIVLRFYDDLSVAQTADALGCSTGTVKSQTSVALARLRRALGDAASPSRQGVPHD